MALPFRWKLFLAFAGFAALIAGLLVAYVSMRLQPIPETLTRELLLTALANAADEIDARDVAELARADDPTTHPAFERLHRTIRRLDDNPPRFSERLKGERGYDKDIYLIVRTDDPDVGRLLVPINREEAGKTYDMARFPAMLEGWDEPAADEHITEDEYGRTLSAYIPIKGPGGETVALLGMDAPAETIDRFRRQIWLTAAAIFGTSLLLALVPAFVMAHRLNRPLRRLSDGMERVAGGDLAEVEPIRTRDEFERAIDQFNRMVRELREKEKLKQALELARHIQQHLLPKNAPALHGLEIAASSQYCDETGGDFFDFIPLAGGDSARLCVAVGDVTGHGVPAALLMTACRAMLRGHAPALGGDLPALFRAVNRQLFADTGGERFVTLLFGVIDPQTRTFQWGSAGHERLIHYDAAAQKLVSLDNTGLILGIEPEAEFGAAEPIDLRPGDVLVLITDGIKDVRNPAGETFGQERLEQTLRKHLDRSAEEIRAALLKELDVFRGTAPQPDDMTLMVIKAI